MIHDDNNNNGGVKIYTLLKKCTMEKKNAILTLHIYMPYP